VNGKGNGENYSPIKNKIKKALIPLRFVIFEGLPVDNGRNGLKKRKGVFSTR
jgi:hypothetical protein